MPPSHHRHSHRHEHHKHGHGHHHEHSGVTGGDDATHIHDTTITNTYPTTNNTYHVPGPTQPANGVPFVVSQCIALLRSLPAKRTRNVALGQIIARLMESEHINGPADILVEIIANVNHYQAIIE